MSKAQKDDPHGASGHRQRLRERFLKNGLESFADYEVVELLLTVAIPRVDVKPAAKALIARFGNLRGILDAKPSELSGIKGVGESAATCLHFLRKVIPIYMQQNLRHDALALDTIDKLIAFFKARLAGEKNEIMEMACFNSELELLPCGPVRIAEGSSNSARIGFRKIIECALANGASSIVLAHNHSGGNCEPSPEDLAFTQRLTLACKPIGLAFIEHIIVAKNSAYSFRRQGHMDKLYDGPPQTESDVAEKRKFLEG